MKDLNCVHAHMLLQYEALPRKKLGLAVKLYLQGGEYA